MKETHLPFPPNTCKKKDRNGQPIPASPFLSYSQPYSFPAVMVFIRTPKSRNAYFSAPERPYFRRQDKDTYFKPNFLAMLLGSASL